MTDKSGSQKYRRRIFVLVAGVVLVGAASILYSQYHPSPPLPKPVFEGDSRELQATDVVLTLDAPIEEGKNVIWCASFLAAWKTLEQDIAREPLTLKGADELALSLDQAADPRPFIPKENLYVAAGWWEKGIVEKITRDLAAKFPEKEPPAFPGIAPDSFLAYAYLEANLRFAIPYFQSRKPLEFTDGEGNKTELSSFGIRGEDNYAYFELRKQPAVLYKPEREIARLTQCVVDLDRNSTPDQIILGLVEPKATLAETLESIDQRIADGGRSRMDPDLGPSDILLVPDTAWQITHRFAELEGKAFTNASLAGQVIDRAQQDIRFRLDRSGAELRSEAKTYMEPVPDFYVFDRPFLLQMKKRGAKMPYFVMWVGNAELLSKWEADELDEESGR
jgi:hypothetical protein